MTDFDKAFASINEAGKILDGADPADYAATKAASEAARKEFAKGLTALASLTIPGAAPVHDPYVLAGYDEPTCDECGVHAEETDWCGECGNCQTHCAGYTECSDREEPEVERTPINLVCPRCSGFIPCNDHPGAYPGAMSRWMAEGAAHRYIEVCSDCGSEEALLQFLAAREGGDPAKAVHPVLGDRPWDVTPDGAL